MKKVAIFLAFAALLLTAASCTKVRNCRCSVLGESTVRYFTIDKGKCEDLRYVLFDPDGVNPDISGYPDITDSVLCTDFDFDSYSAN